LNNLENYPLITIVNETPLLRVCPILSLSIGGTSVGFVFILCDSAFFMSVFYQEKNLQLGPILLELLVVTVLMIYNNMYMETIHLKLNEANLAKSVFMTKMRHDLKTPLNGLLGFLNELIGTEQVLSGECQEHLRDIQMFANNLETQITVLLDVNLMEFGKSALNNEHFDLQENLSFLKKFLSK
jgi:K+-sensing histidine kinase KdpD